MIDKNLCEWIDIGIHASYNGEKILFFKNKI